MSPAEAPGFELNGTSFVGGTTKTCAAVLESLRASRKRVKITYGDPDTMQEWDGKDYGTVGRSCGTEKVPIIVHNFRSTGGGAILTRVILEIAESSGGRVIYRRKAGEE